MNDDILHIDPDTPFEEVIKKLEELGLLEKPKEIVPEYRWYYNDNGDITATCSNPADAEMYGFIDNYIIVDKGMFGEFLKYKVVNAKPELINTDPGQRRQLEKSSTGFAVPKNNAAILLEAGESHPDTEHYDYRTR